MDINNNNANNANNGHIDTFECGCGCKLIFEDYAVGCDIYVGSRGLITEYQMVGDYSWDSYFPRKNFWYQLKEYIVEKYEKCKNNGDEESKGWIHLYNRYCANDMYNGNDTLDYEHLF